MDVYTVLLFLVVLFIMLCIYITTPVRQGNLIINDEIVASEIFFPDSPDTITITMLNASSFVPGQYVFVAGVGTFLVIEPVSETSTVSKSSTNEITLKNIELLSNFTIMSGCRLVSTGKPGSSGSAGGPGGIAHFTEGLTAVALVDNLFTTDKLNSNTNFSASRIINSSELKQIVVFQTVAEGNLYWEVVDVTSLDTVTFCYSKDLNTIPAPATIDINQNTPIFMSPMITNVVSSTQVIVNKHNYAVTLGSGNVSSLKTYLIDGVIDVGNLPIVVPEGGLYLYGTDIDFSFLTSSEDNFTLFTSPVGGSGNMLIRQLTFTVSGTNSQVYDITDSNGFHAIEVDRINYTSCSSLGKIDGYRQGLETNTGRFAGKPSLTLDGNWIGGWRITTSLVRALTEGTYSLFTAGPTFMMNSRFLTDVNCDLPVNVSFSDFGESNFSEYSLLQVSGANFTRRGVSDPADTNIFPNIVPSSSVAVFRQNVGLANTFAGILVRCNTPIETTFDSSNQFKPLRGSYNEYYNTHFGLGVGSNQVTNLVGYFTEFTLSVHFTITGDTDKDYSIRILTNLQPNVYTETRAIDNLRGSVDVGYYSFTIPITLVKNETMSIEVANLVNSDPCTLRPGTSFFIRSR